MDEYHDNNGVPPVTRRFRLSADENRADRRVTPFAKKQIKAEHYGN